QAGLCDRDADTQRHRECRDAADVVGRSHDVPVLFEAVRGGRACVRKKLRAKAARGTRIFPTHA
ncbi:hypothetical protein, partial [Mycolicibacterium phlei]|uniref:hypothetical protein n=1 Tax=Mycolicibacterium phlei TaxID=1771 RepID=UPI001E60FAA4